MSKTETDTLAVSLIQYQSMMREYSLADELALDIQALNVELGYGWIVQDDQGEEWVSLY
jgi:hypothetical protein